MLIDALVVSLIQTTPFTYREDCKDIRQDTIAYHRVVDQESHINLCSEANNYDILIHELWHELHHRIRNTEELLYLDDAWNKIYLLSQEREDYVSEYAILNINEDFAETFEEYYKRGGNIPQDEPDWITPKQSIVLKTKYMLMQIIVQKANISLTQTSWQ